MNKILNCRFIAAVGFTCVLVIGTNAIIVADYVGAFVSKPVIFAQSKTDQFPVLLALFDFGVIYPSFHVRLKCAVRRLKLSGAYFCGSIINQLSMISEDRSVMLSVVGYG